MIVAGLRIDQHDLVALFAQGFAGLGAGIIEFAGLADDDRAGTDEQDFVNIVATRHGLSTFAGTSFAGDPRPPRTMAAV